MIDELRLVVPDAPSDADRDAILAGLIAFNRTHVEPGPTGPLAVLVKDEDGSTVGGLWGSALFEWLRIELLFVPERWRGSAVGSAIMQEAEARLHRRVARHLQLPGTRLLREARL